MLCYAPDGVRTPPFELGTVRSAKRSAVAKRRQFERDPAARVGERRGHDRRLCRSPSWEGHSVDDAARTSQGDSGRCVAWRPVAHGAGTSSLRRGMAGLESRAASGFQEVRRRGPLLGADGTHRRVATAARRWTTPATSRRPRPAGRQGGTGHGSPRGSEASGSASNVPEVACRRAAVAGEYAPITMATDKGQLCCFTGGMARGHADAGDRAGKRRERQLHLMETPERPSRSRRALAYW